MIHFARPSFKHPHNQTLIRRWFVDQDQQTCLQRAQKRDQLMIYIPFTQMLETGLGPSKPWSGPLHRIRVRPLLFTEGPDFASGQDKSKNPHRKGTLLHSETRSSDPLTFCPVSERRSRAAVWRTRKSRRAGSAVEGTVSIEMIQTFTSRHAQNEHASYLQVN